MLRIEVDTTLPPARFQAELIAKARQARLQAKEIAKVRAQFERIGWKPEAARELAEIHVRGVQS